MASMSLGESVTRTDLRDTGGITHLGRLVLVVATHPERSRGALVATLRRPVEQAVVGHCGLEAAGGRDVGPVDGSRPRAPAALAQSKGVLVRNQPEVLFVCVHNAVAAAPHPAE